MKVGNNARFDELDVLRGFAALCVVLSHYTNYGTRYFGESPIDLGHYGYYAVELFFMISGFVIYFTLARSASVLDFAVSRVTRLYPAYWTALTVMVLVEILVFHNRIEPSPIGTHVWWTGYFVNLTMFQEFLGVGNFDNVYWSLTYELAFYVDMALLFAVGLLGRIEFILVPWLALAGVWALLDPHLGATASAPDFVSRILIVRYVPFFAAGIVFYRINAEGATRLRYAILAGALFVEWLIHGAHDLVIALVLFSIFFFSLAGLLRFLISPVTLWLGTISYPLYLIHRNLGYSTLLRLHEDGAPFWIGFFVASAGACTVATILCYAVERPAMRGLRRLYRTVAHTSAQSAATRPTRLTP
jgi:peptidoglycan/LPS O-acetylase OafA/YrhL